MRKREKSKKMKKSVRERDREREKGGRHNPFGAIHRRKSIRREDKRQVLTENTNICFPWVQ